MRPYRSVAGAEGVDRSVERLRVRQRMGGDGERYGEDGNVEKRCLGVRTTTNTETTTAAKFEAEAEEDCTDAASSTGTARGRLQRRRRAQWERGRRRRDAT